MSIILCIGSNFNKSLKLVGASMLLMSASSCAHDSDVDSATTETHAESLPQPGIDCDWTQDFGNASHVGKACTEQKGLHVVATLTQDVDADAINEGFGFLQVHESSPLTSGDIVLVPNKGGWDGTFLFSTIHYGVDAYRWTPSVKDPNATLVPAWSAKTDWQGVSSITFGGFWTNFYVEQFGPAIANGALYMPGRHGTLIKTSLADGSTQATYDPFIGTPFDGDEELIVNNALSVDAKGNVWYTAVAWPLPFDEFGDINISEQPRGTWIVEVRPDGTSRITDFHAFSLAAGLPDTFTDCEWPFGTNGTPRATGPNSQPPVFGCGQQRPALNAPIAFDDSTGHGVMYSYANNAQGYAFLTEFDPLTMTAVNTSNTRNHMLYGCGKRLPLTFKGSRSGTTCATITANGTVNLGNDPDFNRPVSFRIADIMDSAPAIAPNGVRSIAGYDGGFQFGGGYDARGSVVAFNSDGSFASSYNDFGWEVTQSVFNGHYLQDRQLFSTGDDLGIVQLSAGEQNELIQTVPTDDTANAVDFLDAHVPFDTSGTRYAVNATGHLYKFGPDTKSPIEIVELTNSDGSVRSMDGLSSYFARDRFGRIYVSYAGFVYVIAGGGGISTTPTPKISQTVRAKLNLSHSMKTQVESTISPPTPPQ